MKNSNVAFIGALTDVNWSVGMWVHTNAIAVNAKVIRTQCLDVLPSRLTMDCMTLTWKLNSTEKMLSDKATWNYFPHIPDPLIGEMHCESRQHRDEEVPATWCEILWNPNLNNVKATIVYATLFTCSECHYKMLQARRMAN
jgi:hypothetical protein